jgi:hypothetical protein
MDKLYFDVLQTDSMLPKWLGDLDGRSNSFLNIATINRMGNIVRAGDSEDESNANNGDGSNKESDDDCEDGNYSSDDDDNDAANANEE